MKKCWLSVALISGCLMFSAGCSTMVYGTKQKVKVDSVPSGATVILGGQQQTTPAVFCLSGKSGYDLVATKKGYQSGYAHVDSTFRAVPTIIGNILWLLPGLIIDFGTGAAYELQSDVTVQMQKNS